MYQEPLVVGAEGIVLQYRVTDKAGNLTESSEDLVVPPEPKAIAEGVTQIEGAQGLRDSVLKGVGSFVENSDTVTMPSSSPGDQKLAATGGTALGATLFSIALLCIGGGLVLLSHRRRAS